MAFDNRHRCPIGGCSHMIDAHRLMCRPHWRRVSNATASQVNKAWRAWLGVTRAHRSDDVVALARGQYERARDAALIEAARDPGKELAGV